MVVKLLVMLAVMYGVYRQRKKNKAMLSQAAQELNGNVDGKPLGKSRFQFSGADGENCRVWVTEKKGSYPGRLFLQVDRSPQFKFSFKTKRSFWRQDFVDIIPRGQVVPLGAEFDYQARLRARDPIQAQFHFSESRHREALSYLLEAGFNAISADGTNMLAVKDNFTDIDLGAENLGRYASALGFLR